MKIAILSRDSTLYSTKRFVEAIEQKGHEAQVIDYLKCFMNINTKKPSMIYDGQELNFDAIIPRIGTSNSFYGAAIVRQFEAMNTYSINPSIAITRSRDKLRSQQILARKGIDMPVTGIAHSPSETDALIELVGGVPLIIKLVEGTQGVGVVLAETKQAADSVIQTLMGLNVNIIIQEFIKESKGQDLRCFVVGKKVVAAMKRTAGADEFRANIHRGGTGEQVKITKEEREIAIKAASIMGLRMAGVDLLRSKRGTLVLEVNSSPGLEGIEKATGKDIAGVIVEHIIKHAKPMNDKTHYQG